MNENSTKNKTNGSDLYFKRAVVILLTVTVGFVIFLFLMNRHLITTSQTLQIQKNERFFATTISNLNNNDREIDSLIAKFNSNNSIMLDDLVMAYSNDSYRKLRSMSKKDQSDILYEATSTMEYCRWILMLDKDGDVFMSDVEENVGLSISQSDFGLTMEDFHDLCDEKIKYKCVDNPYTDPELSPASELYLYCKAIPGSEERGNLKYILISFSSEMIDEAEDRLKDLSSWMNASSVGNSTSTFMVNASSDMIEYGTFQNADLAGEKASEKGFDSTVLSDGFRGWAVLDGVKSFVSVKAYSSELYGHDNYIVVAIPEKDLLRTNLPVAVWNICLFLFFTVLLIAYCAHVRKTLIDGGDNLKKVKIFKNKKGNVYLCGALAEKIIPIVLFSTLLLFFAAFYFQLLMKMSESFSESVRIENDISKSVAESAEVEGSFNDYYDLQYESRAKLMAFMISLNGSDFLDPNKNANSIKLFDDSEGGKKRNTVKDEYNNEVSVISSSQILEDLRESNHVEQIYLISDSGATMATSSAFWNFSLSKNQEDQSFEFWDVIYGKSGSVVQDVMENDEGKLSQYIGCALDYYTCLDDNGDTRFVGYTDYIAQANGEYSGNEITHHTGLLQIELNPDAADIIIDSAKPEYVLANNRISNDGFLMGFYYDNEKEDYRVFYSPVSDMNDKYASELGISSNAFSGDYNGFQTIGSNRYLQSFRKAADYFVATAIPVASLYYSCAKTSIFSTVLTFAMMLIIAICMIFVSDHKPPVGDDQATGVFAVPARNKKSGKWQWTNHSYKFETILRNGLIILGTVFFATAVIEGNRFGNDSAFFYILSGKWDRGVHIFSLSACVLIIIASTIAIKLVGYVAGQIASAFGNSAVTMIRLLVSLIKVVAIAIVVLYCLFLLGIDATSLLASAGIMSVVVGLGAQSLVGDLLAGIFIIMEGSLHVGDYVLINDVRGKVIEIGLRTTKYEDGNQNIRIICNNELKAFANMSMKYSVVNYDIPVPYNEDYPRIRKILNEEFLKIYEENRFLKSIPVCQGIENFADSSVELRVRFMCEEDERFNVQRFMHDEIMRIFMENDISIPFNQIDIHMDTELIPAADET